MSPKLKPLILPQLVEERKKQEALKAQAAEGDLGNIYYTTNSSSSDVTSPVTPTFSARGHLRYSSSASSLDLPPNCAESPASPSQPAHSTKSGKSQLPDVEEEPTEREDLDLPTGLDGCFCDLPCAHQSSPDMIDDIFPPEFDFNYDVGFLSEGDVQEAKRIRALPESAISGIANRVGSRLQSMSRWRSNSKRSSPTAITALTAHSTTEFATEQPLPESCPGSSRSSSISSPNKSGLEKMDQSLTMSPAPSFWESTDSISPNPPAPVDVDKANSQQSIERDRAMATTPLLPPLITDALNPPAQQSPLQSPAVETSPHLEPQPVSQPKASSHTPTPSLSTRPSVASFRPSPTGAELPIPFPNILCDDAWSDRLGHANFTILPTPYQPEEATLDALIKLRADWDTARVNYTKHIVRTGENYGQTSKIYALTEEKWAEVEKTWRTKHDQTMDKILAASNAAHRKTSSSRSRSRGRGRGRAGSSSATLMGRPGADEVLAGVEWKRLEEAMPSAIPRMLDESKFPARGDEDIVGPMVRDAVMARTRSEERKSSRLWKNLIGKVGLRK